MAFLFIILLLINDVILILKNKFVALKFCCLIARQTSFNLPLRAFIFFENKF